jgi:hypothetical protein
MDKQTLTFTLEKETKNAIRYQEDAEGLLGKEPPRKLTITIGQ